MPFSVVARFLIKYTPYLILPVTGVIGFIGYKLESMLSDKYTPSLQSVKEKREERMLTEEQKVESLKEHSFVPKTIFEKNLSPSLLEPNPKLGKYS